MSYAFTPDQIDALRNASYVGPYDEEDVATPVGRIAHLWFVIRIKEENFSEDLQQHPDIDFWLSKDGELAGIALDQNQLFKLVNDWKPESAKNNPQRYVHLIYKARIQGNTDVVKLLEFMHENGMLETPT